MVKNPLSYNANAFFRLTTFMVGKKLEIKITPAFYWKTMGSNFVEQIRYCAKHKGRLQHKSIFLLLLQIIALFCFYLKLTLVELGYHLSYGISCISHVQI